MNRHSIQMAAMALITTLSTPLQAGETNLHAYAIMQECIAQGLHVTDNGSYERFCIDQYLATTAQSNNK